MNKILLMILLGVCVVFSAPPTHAQEVATEQLFPKRFVDTVTRTGKLDFKRTLTLSFKSQGYLTQLKVDEGEYFEKDSLLAALEISELQERANSTYAELIKAKSALRREKKMVNDDLSSEERMENAQTMVETRRAAYRIADYNLQKSTIKAPFSGVVLSRHTELGELQNPGTSVLTVAPTENNWVVKVALTEAEVTRLAIGTIVDVRIDKLGIVQGKVSKIPAQADSHSNLFNIEVALPNLKVQPGIIAGQIAEVSIIIGSDESVFQVPMKAIMSVNENGQAILATKNLSNDRFEAQAFDIRKLSNQYVFLVAKAPDSAINVVTTGWQHIRIGL